MLRAVTLSLLVLFASGKAAAEAASTDPCIKQAVADPTQLLASKAYTLALSNSVCELRKVHDIFIGEKWQSLCPQKKPADRSTCFRKWMESKKINTFTEITLLQSIAVAVAMRDKENNIEYRISLMQMLDNTIFTLEKYNAEDSFLSHYKPKNSADVEELRLLKKEINPKETGFANEMIDVVDKKIKSFKAELTSSHSSSSGGSSSAKEKEVTLWIDKMLLNIESRLEKIKTKKFIIPM
jgi:hypothetical protein